MTISYSIKGQKKTAGEIRKAILMCEAIVTACSSARRRVRAGRSGDAAL